MILLLLTLVGAFTCGQKEAVVSFSYFEVEIRGRKKIREKMYLFNNVPLVDTNSLKIHAVLLNHFEIHLLVDIRNSNGNFLKNIHEWYYSGRPFYYTYEKLKKCKFKIIALKSFSNYSVHWFFALMRAVFIRLQLLLMSFSSFQLTFLQLIKFDKLDY